MSKSALHTMTKSLAVEWGPHGIRINAIAPGPFPTEGAWQRLFPKPFSSLFNLEKKIENCWEPPPADIVVGDCK